MVVEIIQSSKELESTKPFQIDKLLWGTESIPKTYGYIGFVPGDGFYVKMVCEEKNPLRNYTQDKSPVYRDSAMEAFFMFEPEKDRRGAFVYLNFEMNANGALLAAYGKERIYRTYFPENAYEAFGCRALIEEKQWSVSFRIPLVVLNEVYGALRLEEGSRFSCNFYKISETEAIEHYASYALIETEIPSFHLPEFFETAVLAKKY